MYANVIVDIDAPGLSQPFTYRVPEELEEALCVGACVSVPFSGREMVGYVLNLTDEDPNLNSIKDVNAVIPDACRLDPSLLNLARWISDYYLVSLSHSVRAIVPEVMSATVSSTVSILNPEGYATNSPNQKRLLELLVSLGGKEDADILKVRFGPEKFGQTLRQLKDRRAVEVVRCLELPKARPLVVRGLKLADDEDFAMPDALAGRAPRQAEILRELAESVDPVRQSELLRRIGSSAAPVKALIDKGLAEKVDLKVRRKPFGSREVPDRVEYVLTNGQKDALEAIREGLEQGIPQTTLLYGVTGSGKTEVYLRSIADVLERGESCISLVPEISLTAHLMDVYRSHFGDKMAILHSKLSVGERHDEWKRIESGEARVVLGPRSAVFAPVHNLGLMVVDEEHETSYKQDHTPRYNARLAAEERARAEGVSIILGSATPSMETFYRASTGDIKLAIMDKRVDNRSLPSVEIVDQREEFAQGRRNIFSERLQSAIGERLKRKEQTILFINRRGYASFILCRTCGYTAKCSNCDVSLTYHTAPIILRCHHCGESRKAPTVCPNCGGPHIRQFGIGTERVEEEARKIFPEASIIRMDSDTTRRKNAHLQILDEFRSGRADILVGTQMVAKGLDFHNVTLVGVISADTILNLPDFRAAERTFQLLTQVSGRAGRGNIPGQVVIQSFSPDHYAVRAAARQDYLGFYNQEIIYRRELKYPPFSMLLNIVSSDPVDGYAENRLKTFVNIFEKAKNENIEILGPVPAPISKLKGLYRWHLVLRGSNLSAEDFKSAINGVMDEMPNSIKSDLIVDVDPLTML